MYPRPLDDNNLLRGREPVTRSVIDISDRFASALDAGM